MPDPTHRERQAGINRTTADAWSRYAPHRQRVMAMVPDGRDALLLGAGNCNDVDLRALAERFEALHLADVDGVACDAAVKRATIEARVHAVELTGLVDRLATWKETPPEPKALRSLTAEASRGVAARLPGPFDVVISAGLLSQIVLAAIETLGLEHAAFGPVSVSLVVAHLQLALGLLRPGGALVLVVDTAPRPPGFFEALPETSSLSELLAELEALRQCVPATELGFVVSALRHLAPGAAIEMSEPWLWPIAHDRTSLVYGLVCRRPAGS